MTQWRIVFWGQAAVLLTVLLFYTWLASGEVQPWNHPDYNRKMKGKSRGFAIFTLIFLVAPFAF